MSPRDLKIPAERHPEKAHRPDTERLRKPDWSRVNTEPSPASRGAVTSGATTGAVARACHDGCVNHCALHGHDHHIAWNHPLSVADSRSFWGALGCSCFAV